MQYPVDNVGPKIKVILLLVTRPTLKKMFLFADPKLSISYIIVYKRYTAIYPTATWQTELNFII